MVSSNLPQGEPLHFNLEFSMSFLAPRAKRAMGWTLLAFIGETYADLLVRRSRPFLGSGKGI